jgi:hypothetical protein
VRKKLLRKYVIVFQHEKASLLDQIGDIDGFHPDSSESENARVVRSNYISDR